MPFSPSVIWLRFLFLRDRTILVEAWAGQRIRPGFCLNNKYPPAKPGVFHMRAKPSDPRGHVKRVIRSASRAGTVTCYP